MCGICGFKRGINADIQSDTNVIKNMCNALAHRGPDGEGFYINDEIALGHRRLSLIDLSGGAQPMVRVLNTMPSLQLEGSQDDPDATLVITFNGEIYNYQDLAKELTSLGWEFETHSDTEVLLAGYAIWGKEELLDKLRGMFAFAIWDSRDGSLFCARDPFGIKPFYYSTNNGSGFVFASEAKAILQYPPFEKELNIEALEYYLCFQFNPLNETFFKGIFKLPAAHYMVVKSDGEIELTRYWRPVFKENKNLTAQEASDKIEQAMLKTVERHNVADVEVGAYLSSGIDSSYTASVLSKINPDLKTFTVGFSELSNGHNATNEIVWAEELAELIGTSQKSEHVTKEDFFDAVKSVQWHMDEPSADPASIPLFYLNRMAAMDVKAVLSGEGADELFAGYRLYETPLTAKKATFLPKWLLKPAASIFAKLNLKGANYLKRASSDISEWYYTNANDKAFSKDELENILEIPFNSVLPTKIVEESYKQAKEDNLDDVKSMQLVDIQHWLVDDILLKADKMSMANSLECRVPYLDIDVFELASTLPTSLNVSTENTKIALRRSAKNTLPKEWAEKQKLGFPVPLSEWLRNDDIREQVTWYFQNDTASKYFNTEELMNLLNEHQSGKDMSRKIWIIWMFLIWHQLYFPEEWEATRN